MAAVEIFNNGNQYGKHERKAKHVEKSHPPIWPTSYAESYIPDPSDAANDFLGRLFYQRKSDSRRRNVLTGLAATDGLAALGVGAAILAFAPAAAAVGTALVVGGIALEGSLLVGGLIGMAFQKKQ